LVILLIKYMFKELIKIILRYFTKTNTELGALIDTRPEKEKEEDYTFDEIVASAEEVKWVEKVPTQWRSFPIFNQNGSGSCVAQTMAKILGVMRWLKDGIYIHFSATHIYQRRSNKPRSGMNGIECFKIAQKGVTLEELVPSQNMTDAQMDSVVIEEYKKQVGEVFKIGNFITMPIKNIDLIASVIQKTGKAVMVWFYFENGEWNNTPKVINKNLNLSAYNTSRHSVTAVDYALIGGKKALIIEDSWGVRSGFTGQRVITEEFFKERNWFCAYPMNFKFDEPVDNTPKYTFNEDLKYSAKYSVIEEVKKLQSALKYLGHFPSNIDCTGYYGSITTKSVLAFQQKYQIYEQAGKLCGAKTRKQLNLIFK